MKNLVAILLFFILIQPVIDGQQSLNKDSLDCNSPESRQFNFWIGDWDIQQKILNKDGSWLETNAHTSVSSILNGCALEEHWEGDVKFFWNGMDSIEHMKGFSIRYFDSKKNEWNIHWLDNKNLQMGTGFTGNFKNGKGEFFRETNNANENSISRITFSNFKKNSVHWDLSFSKDNGETWTTLWIMDMKRREN